MSKMETEEVDTNTKVLTVSVAAYNVEATLRQTLDSLTAPEVQDALEVLIVNDGSSDTTPEIALEYEEKYPETFRLITKENGGWGSTLNTGIEQAKGKYYKPLDGDDFFLPEDLPLFLDFLRGTDADLVLTPFGIVEYESGGLLSVVSRIREFMMVQKTLDMRELRPFFPAIHAAAVCTKVLQDAAVRITEHCFYTDLEFMVKAVNVCQTFNYMELPVYMYRVGRDGQSMSVSGIRRHYREHQQVLLTCLDYWKQEVTDPYKKELLEERLLKASAVSSAGNITGDADLFFMSGKKFLNLLRKFHFAGYKILGRQNTRQDYRLKRHIFEDLKLK